MGSEKKLKKKKIKHGVEKKKGTWRWKTEREDERLKKGLFGARFPLLSPDFFLQKPPSCCPFFSLHTTLRIFSLQCMCCPKISSNACVAPFFFSSPSCCPISPFNACAAPKSPPMHVLPQKYLPMHLLPKNPLSSFLHQPYFLPVAALFISHYFPSCHPSLISSLIFFLHQAGGEDGRTKLQ